MAFEAKKTLILRIYQILDQYSDEQHPLKQQDIIDILRHDFGIECERKAVGRNISYLKEAGAEIESTPNGSYLANRRFEKSELRLLIDSVLCSRHINPTHSEQLINKLIQLGGRNFKSHVKHVKFVKEWEKSENRAFFLNVELACEAIEQSKKICFDYNKTGLDKKLHKSNAHTASPYQMLLHNQRYYIMLYDDNHQKVLYLRLDKITNMHILDESGIPLRDNPGFTRGISYHDISTAMPYMFSDSPVPITMRCPLEMTDALCDWFGTDVTMRDNGDGYLNTTVRASENAMLFWALQYNCNAEILSPASLRDKVVATLNDTLAMYAH